ncbi:YrhK-like protein [Mumia flava]|uniref:YrhK-like protein n=1 Tax=Mumia flava TaxID=1348852 RepID=A0A0B2B5Y2_9ACTN|nr:YrhK family protein [Mumia flava]PJJ54333.1 YrhK-like protein [Mumia flava]
MSPDGPTSADDGTVGFRIGHAELVIRDRYEVLSIANDILIGVWFLVGSVLFFFSSTAEIGTALFVLGSIEMLIRPGIRLARRIHLKRLHPELAGGGSGSADY